MFGIGLNNLIKIGFRVSDHILKQQEIERSRTASERARLQAEASREKTIEENSRYRRTMLEDEIADVIYELESLEKNKRGIEKKTSYAPVDISMTEYVKSEDIKDSESLTDAGEAFNMTMKGMGEFFEVFGLGLAAAAPVLILIAVIVVGTLFAIKGIKILIKKAKNTKKQP